MSVDEKRARVEALKVQLAERKAALEAKTTVANEQVREQRLDREIDRLEAELAALAEVPEPTGELSTPEVPEQTGPGQRVALEEQAASLGVRVTGRMTDDQLIDAIRTASGSTQGGDS